MSTPPERPTADATMATTVIPRSPQGNAIRTGLLMSLASSAAFGSSGAIAKSLLEIGWTPAAAVLIRLGGAAVVLGLVAVFVVRRARWRPTTASVRIIAAYGVVAMAGAQLSYFNAVRTLDVGVALLLEFLAPVLLLVAGSVRRRALPPLGTAVGAALTMVGLVFILEPTAAGSIDLGGVAWGLTAAVCLAAYFVLSERLPDGLPPVVMAAGGTAVGAVVVGLAGITGIAPLAFETGTTMLAGQSVHWLVPTTWLVVIATAAAYLTGIGAILRLGPRTASFVALTEVLFAVLIAWALLAELPGPAQLIGGAVIVVGIVLVQRGDRRPVPAADASVLADAGSVRTSTKAR